MTHVSNSAALHGSPLTDAESRALIEKSYTCKLAGDAAYARQDFGEARQLYRLSMDLAMSAGHRELALAPAPWLERLGDYEGAWRAYHFCQERTPSAIPEWDGGSLEGKTLLVERQMCHDGSVGFDLKHIGFVVRHLRFLAPVARQAGAVVIELNERMHELVRRSFPGVRVVSESAASEQAADGADCRISLEGLCRYFAQSWAAMVNVPPGLVADEAQSRSLRKRYILHGDRQGQGPLIGINWHSANPDKEPWTLEQWAEVLAAGPDAVYLNVEGQSLRDEAEQLAVLSGREILTDDGVDQFGDLDPFFAQMHCLDGLLSLSNTGVHVAGSVSTPTLLLRNTDKSLIWNVTSDREPWYPALRKLSTHRMDWAEQKREALAFLDHLNQPANASE